MTPLPESCPWLIAVPSLAFLGLLVALPCGVAEQSLWTCTYVPSPRRCLSRVDYVDVTWPEAARGRERGRGRRESGV